MIIATFAGILAANNRYTYCGNKNLLNALRRGNKHTGVLCLRSFFLFNRIINFKHKIKMENSEKPIYPTIFRQIGENEFRIASTKDQMEGQYLSSEFGITKREYFAAMALSGIMANSRSEPTHSSHFRNIAEDAVKAADAVLSFLNEA